MASYESELELELESELESHESHEHELESEFELETGAHEFELESPEHESESHEHEFETHEHEFETHEHESEYELESEFESGEQFFGKIFRGVKGLVRKAAPLLSRVASVAAPLVAKAVGGPFGAILGNLGGLLGEHEAESEMESESELESEFESHESHEHESEFEAHELAAHEFESEHEHEHEHEHEAHELLAEHMASAAAMAATEHEAEAMIGAASVSILSPRDQRAIQRLIPRLVRGASVLTRILRRQRLTRPAIRAVPQVVRTTSRVLARRAAAGRPVNRRIAGRVMAAQTRRIIGNPHVCAAAIMRNVRRTSGGRSRPRRVGR